MVSKTTLFLLALGGGFAYEFAMSNMNKTFAGLFFSGNSANVLPSYSDRVALDDKIDQVNRLKQPKRGFLGNLVDIARDPVPGLRAFDEVTGLNLGSKLENRTGEAGFQGYMELEKLLPFGIGTFALKQMFWWRYLYYYVVDGMPLTPWFIEKVPMMIVITAAEITLLYNLIKFAIRVAIP